MPNNYVALSDTPDKKECDEILKKAREQTDELIALIQQDRPFPESHASFKEKAVQRTCKHTLLFPFCPRSGVCSH